MVRRPLPTLAVLGGAAALAFSAAGSAAAQDSQSWSLSTSSAISSTSEAVDLADVAEDNQTTMIILDSLCELGGGVVVGDSASLTGLTCDSGLFDSWSVISSAVPALPVMPELPELPEAEDLDD
jgi:hypothetical protein